MASVMLGQGTILSRENDATPAVYDPIDGITTLSGPTASTDQLDVTTLDGSARTFASGLLDPGEITFSAFYDPADTEHNLLEADFTGGTVEKFKILFGSSAAGTEACLFSGIVTGYSLSASSDSPVTLDVTIKISGVVTWP